MMNDLDEAELSAFLDGELDAARSERIEALIASDRHVRAAFDRLKIADLRLKSVAEAAAFRPVIRLPTPARLPAGSWLALSLLAVLIAWTVGKLTPSVTTALVANAASLILFTACLVRLAIREARAGAPFAS
jgi:anti-sigma factor RsiW